MIIIATALYFLSITSRWWYSAEISADAKAVCDYLSAIWLAVAALYAKD